MNERNPRASDEIDVKAIIRNQVIDKSFYKPNKYLNPFADQSSMATISYVSDINSFTYNKLINRKKSIEEGRLVTLVPSVN
jgi:hypothetical protein